MNINILKAFRHDMYRSMKQAQGALFNLLDALVSEDRAQSLPELSLSPHFQRKWPSIYEALEDGCIEDHKQQKMFSKHAPVFSPFLLIAADVSSIARPKARIICQKVRSLSRAVGSFRLLWPCQKSRAGGRMSSHRRIETCTTAIQIASQKLSELAPQMPKESIALLTVAMTRHGCGAN